MKTADATNPTSWNRYAFVSGDPVNSSDPGGMEQASPCGPGWEGDPSLQGPCCDPAINNFLGVAQDPACYAGGGGDGGGGDGGESPTCGSALNFQADSRSNVALLAITSFFEDEAAISPGSKPNSTITSIWTAIDWTFENRAALTAQQKAAFYGPSNVPQSFDAIVTGPQGSQVWSNGQLKPGFASQLNSILNGDPNSPLCNGFAGALNIATGVVGGTIADNVPGALQFASGGAVPGHSGSITEQPVAKYGTFTFYRPVPKKRRKR